MIARVRQPDADLGSMGRRRRVHISQVSGRHADLVRFLTPHNEHRLVSTRLWLLLWLVLEGYWDTIVQALVNRVQILRRGRRSVCTARFAPIAARGHGRVSPQFALVLSAISRSTRICSPAFQRRQQTLSSCSRLPVAHCARHHHHAGGLAAIEIVASRPPRNDRRWLSSPVTGWHRAASRLRCLMRGRQSVTARYVDMYALGLPLNTACLLYRSRRIRCPQPPPLVVAAVALWLCRFTPASL